MGAAGAGSILGQDLREHHRRCVPALADLRLLARTEGGEPLSAHAVLEMDTAIGVVLDELSAANKRVFEAFGGHDHPSRGRRAFGVLEARLVRAQTAAEEIGVALGNGDVPAAQRRLEQFHVLVSALRTIQLDVHGGAPA